MAGQIDDAIIATVIARNKKGETLVDISRDLDLQSNSVSQALHRRGIKLRRKSFISNAELEEAKSLYSSGKSQQQVADIIGIKRSSLSAKFKLINFKCRARSEVSASRRLDKETIRKAHKVYLEDRTTSSIAESLGIHKATLINHFHYYDFEVKSWGKFSKDFVQKTNKKILKGFSLAELAQKYDFSLGGFGQAAKRLGISVNKTVYIPIVPGTLLKARGLWDEGSTLKQISLLLEQPETSLTYQLKKHNFIPRTNRGKESISKNLINKERIDVALRLYWDAKSIKEIAKLIGALPKEIRDALNSKGIYVSPRVNITDVQIKLIHTRRINEKIGISTLCDEYDITPSSVYSRCKGLGLKLERSMGTARATYTESQIRRLYHEAHKRDCSIAQLLKDRGLNEREWVVTSNGRALGLKPPDPKSMKGHEARNVNLYILRIISGNGIIGLYAGSSIDPKKRMKQHFSTGVKNEGANLRDQFIHEAHISATEKELALIDWFSIEVLGESYTSAEIAERETELIRKIQVECSNDAKKEFLNTLIGAPSGGYGRKFSILEEQEVVNLYNSGMTTEKIAERLIVGRSTINRTLQRYDAMKSSTQYLRKFSDADRAKAYALYKEGHTQAKIAQKLKMGTATLSKIIRTFKANEKDKRA